MSLFGETGALGIQSIVSTLGSGPGSLVEAAASAGVSTRPCSLRPVLSFPRRFSAMLRELAPRIVHSHVHGASGWLLWMANRAGVPVRVAHSHTTVDGHRSTPGRLLYRALSRRLISRHATAGIGVSASSAEALFGDGWARDSRFRVIHTGIDLSPFSRLVRRDEVRRGLQLPADATVVGHVGRFHAVKNQRFFLRVANLLARRDPRMRFLLVGEGPLRGDIERLADDLRIRHLCVFTGERADVARLLMGAMDLLLFPSLWEGLPISLIEAQAAGLPIVASASVTPEVAAVPGLVRFERLDRGPGRWADEVRAALVAPRPSPDDARSCLARSDFDIRQSARNVLAAYGFPDIDGEPVERVNRESA